MKPILTMLALLFFTLMFLAALVTTPWRMRRSVPTGDDERED